MLDLIKATGSDVHHLLMMSISDNEGINLSQLVEFYETNSCNYLYKLQKDQLVLGVIGFQMLCVGEARILHIAVDPQCRKQGVGRSLIENAATLHQISRFEAEINWDSAYFFRACGFRVWSLGSNEEECEIEILKCVRENKGL